MTIAGTRRTKAEEREIALSVARGQARHLGLDPLHLSVDDAMTMLDDMYRRDPELIAAQWYAAMSNRQYQLFRQEWNIWLKSVTDRADPPRHGCCTSRGIPS